MNQSDAIEWRVLGAEQLTRLAAAASRVFADEPAVVAAWFYGSARTGRRPARDVDVGIAVRSIPDRRELGRLAHALATAAGMDEAILDLRVLNGASPVFLNEVLRNGERIYEADREERIRFEASAIARWLDFEPVWRRTRERVLARWSHG
jgi:predicted nucleotidyltransferase